MLKRDGIHKTGSVSTPSEQDRGRRQHAHSLVKFGRTVPEKYSLIDTHIHTNTVTSHQNLPGAERSYTITQFIS